jgi:hypothetical protein
MPARGDFLHHARAARGSSPRGVAPPLDPRRVDVAQRYISWLHEWREIARVAVARLDYRLALGLGQRKRRGGSDDGDDAAEAAAQ